MMEYRELLKKYMNHILSCEGIDYISKCNNSPEVHFTDEEITELENISNEVNNEEFTIEEQEILINLRNEL